MSKPQQPVLLMIAGSDSGGGAGIQTDLKTCWSLGVHGTCALTAITAQNTLRVEAVSVLDPALVMAQIEAVYVDFSVDVVKLGMLGNGAVVSALADWLEQHPDLRVVLDPVMVSTTGSHLLDEAGVGLVRDRLLPRACILTPNLQEAALLTGKSLLEVEEDPVAAGAQLCGMGADFTLIKGGHTQSGKARDWLVSKDSVEPLDAPRVETRNNHGTGCTLATAIAAFMVRGSAIPEAAGQAKSFLTRALQNGRLEVLGHGAGPALLPDAE